MGIYLGPFKVTKRGVRVRIGPRIARVHVGAGRPGISTGFGPFTAYAPLSGKKKRPAQRSEPSAPFWSADMPDGSSCPHRHRSEAAALECERRIARQAGLSGRRSPAAYAEPVWSGHRPSDRGTCVRCGQQWAEHSHDPGSAFLDCPEPAEYDLARHLLSDDPPGKPALCSRCGQPFEAHLDGGQLACPQAPAPRPEATEPGPVPASQRPAAAAAQGGFHPAYYRAPRRFGWPGWTAIAAVAGLVIGFTLSVIGGSNSHDAAASASGAVTVIAVLALLVAIAGSLYRKYRLHHARRIVARQPQAVAMPAPACSRCGYPLEAHAAPGLTCPGPALQA